MTRILVVDDDIAVRSIVSDALRQDGYVVDTAANGREALAAFSHRAPDAVVLDLSMPEMDGAGLVTTLREQTNWGRVPLVVVSSDSEAQAESVRLGARACVTKPFDLPEFLLTIRAIAPR